MEVTDRLINWVISLEEGEPVEWETFCHHAGLPHTEAGNPGHAENVQIRNSLRAALNTITRKFTEEHEDDEVEGPFELLSVRVEDEDWKPDPEIGETEDNRPLVRVLMKLGGNGRLEARMHHHITRNNNAPKNMVRDMRRIAKDKTLTDDAKALANRLVKAATIQMHFVGKYMEKAINLKRLSDATANRCLADAMIKADKDK